MPRVSVYCNTASMGLSSSATCLLLHPPTKAMGTPTHWQNESSLDYPRPTCHMHCHSASAHGGWLLILLLADNAVGVALPSSASSPSKSAGGSAAQPAQVGSRSDPTVASYLGEWCADPSCHRQKICIKGHDWANCVTLDRCCVHGEHLEADCVQANCIGCA